MRAVALLLMLALAAPVAADHTGDILYDAGAEFAPTPAEVQAVIDSVRNHSWASVHEVGSSLSGEPIFVVEITDPESDVPMAERVVTFLMTQQHGNEPAGTPAALRLLEELRDGTAARQYLSNQVLLVMPQSNPDGAVDNRRTNDDGVDINRDHVHISTPEAAAIHEVLKRWDVHFAFDHHEYGGTGIGYPVPVQTYDFDITTMYPNHGNVRQPTRDLSEEFNYGHLKPRLESEGYTHGDYGVQTVTAGPFQHETARVAGGPDPGILRNNYGLNNVAGLLIESYIPPQGDMNPLQSFERRVASQYIVMDEVLRFAHENPAKVIEAKRESERLNREEPMEAYVEGSRTGPLDPAYLAADDISELLERHGLPPALPTAEGDVHLLDHGRAGLLAAMLHPQSSRQVTEAQGTAYEGPVPLERVTHRDYGSQPLPVQDVPEDEQASALMPALMVLALVGLALRRR